MRKLSRTSSIEFHDKVHIIVIEKQAIKLYPKQYKFFKLLRQNYPHPVYSDMIIERLNINLNLLKQYVWDLRHIKLLNTKIGIRTHRSYVWGASYSLFFVDD